jgi:DNA-binding transcriptional LysR family regulator
MDRVTSMTSFVKVADNGGFSAAARKLNLSTGVVTGHIKSLEDHLGVRLLNRNTRKVSLTEVGQAYYERCVQILAEIDDADQIAEALQSKPRGPLHINMAPVLPMIFAPIITAYTALYSDVSVRITVTSRMIDLVDGGYDLAIRIIPVSDSSQIVRRLASYRYVVCGAPKYFAEHGHPKTPEDLVNHNCITYSDSPWNSNWHFKSADGEKVVHPSGNLQANSSDALRLSAMLGQGLIYAPTFMVADWLQSGQLVATLTKFETIEMTVDAIYPHRRYLAAKVRTFIDLAAKDLHDTNWTSKQRAPSKERVQKETVG